MQAVLVMFRSDGERRSFSITRDMTVVGRREDCDLRIPLGDVSRKHCRLVRDGDTLRLEDLGSSNGTFHNGQRVQEVIVNPGDTIQVGPVVFVMQIDGIPADEEIQVPTAELIGASTEDDSVTYSGQEPSDVIEMGGVSSQHPVDELLSDEPLAEADAAAPAAASPEAPADFLDPLTLPEPGASGGGFIVMDEPENREELPLDQLDLDLDSHQPHG